MFFPLLLLASLPMMHDLFGFLVLYVLYNVQYHPELSYIDVHLSFEANVEQHVGAQCGVMIYHKDVWKAILSSLPLMSSKLAQERLCVKTCFIYLICRTP